jgi:DMSO/TMAO reductase YedYZ molybdopterin-dependent catalytic subunit
MNGASLEPQHGAPVRLVVPGWYGMAHVKWLRGIVALDHPFDGYHQTVAYRYSQSREEPGEPVTLMRVRSLLAPPSLPDFLTRTRVVRHGVVELHGRAWSGRAAIARVEVSADGGASWFPRHGRSRARPALLAGVARPLARRRARRPHPALPRVRHQRRDAADRAVLDGARDGQ